MFRLLHQHPAKTPFQRRILLQAAAIFLLGGGADHPQLAPGQQRLQNIGRIDGAFRCACPHHRVQLIHKQDGVALPADLFQQVFQPLLKIAPVFGARHQAGHVQTEQPAALQCIRHPACGNPLGQRFGQRGFAHPRLAHQTGVILLAAAKDFNHPFQLTFPTEHRVQPALRRNPGQILAVSIAGPAAPAGRRGTEFGLQRQHQLAGKLATLLGGGIHVHPQLSQPATGSAGRVLQYGAEHMLALGLLHAGSMGPQHRKIQCLAAFRHHIFRAQAAGSIPRLLLPPSQNLCRSHTTGRQQIGRRASPLGQNRQQDMTGAHLPLPLLPCQRKGQIQHFRRAAGKAFKPVAHCHRSPFVCSFRQEYGPPNTRFKPERCKKPAFRHPHTGKRTFFLLVELF